MPTAVLIVIIQVVFLMPLARQLEVVLQCSFWQWGQLKGNTESFALFVHAHTLHYLFYTLYIFVSVTELRINISSKID